MNYSKNLITQLLNQPFKFYFKRFIFDMQEKLLRKIKKIDICKIYFIVKLSP